MDTQSNLDLERQRRYIHRASVDIDDTLADTVDIVHVRNSQSCHVVDRWESKPFVPIVDRRRMTIRGHKRRVASVVVPPTGVACALVLQD